MAYSSDALKKALEQKKQAAKLAEKEYQRKLAEVYEAVPELDQIDIAQQKIGSEIVAAAIAGESSELEELKLSASALEQRRAQILNSAGVVRPEYNCPLCCDTGYVGASLCDCVKSEAKKIRIQELSTKVPMQDSDFSNFKLGYYPNAKDENGVVPRKRMSAILDYCRDYSDNFEEHSESILFLGSAGLGKTHLSLAIAGKIIDRGFDVVYNTSQNLFYKLENEYFSHTGSDYLETLLECDLLIIDDLGTEFSTQFTQSALYNIINTRLLSSKSTIINTNLSLREIEERYTARISSRFIGNYIMKKFAGMDIRQLKLTGKTVE